ncbi:NUDIX hydrolase domain-like protein [Mycena olivaceomarginata]|nr:NUDIX hydrolase domain-like protein [Mycena olivaceomarginata]
MSDKSAPKPLNLKEYHRPKRIKLTDARIPPLSAESKRCLKNLASYRPKKSKFPFPREKSAAVLVALFVGRLGICTRSSTLRSYAGDTSLPGGKVDPEDRTIEETARREAFEEIGLPRNKLQPFLASNHLIVTPVRITSFEYPYLIPSVVFQPILNASEVASLFSHPLASFLSSSPPFPTESELVELLPTRAHRFLTGREAGGIKPVFGLTAFVLFFFLSPSRSFTSQSSVKAASVAHAPRLPDFEVMPPGAPSPEARIAWVVYSNPAFREAYERERLRVDWKAVARVAGVKKPEEGAKTKSSIRHWPAQRRIFRSKL